MDTDLSENISNTSLGQFVIPPGWKWPLVVNMCLVMVVGTAGNGFTLVSLPYVRAKYGNEFSVLQTSTAVLLFHLSFCDLLYCLLGFPHFIQLAVQGYYPWDPSGPLCWFLGWSRNLVAHVDFATLAAIAICVCKQKLCRTCRRSGTITQHGDHDKIFGGRRIIIVILLIWIYHFVLMIPKTFNVSWLQ